MDDSNTTEKHDNDNAKITIHPIIKNNNNHHVVPPVGILIVLFTLYLTATALQRNYDCYFDKDLSQSSSSSINNNNVGKDLNIAQQQQHKIAVKLMDKFLEHKDICYDLAIFVKPLKETQQQQQQQHFVAVKDLKSSNLQQTTKQNRTIKISNGLKQNNNKSIKTKPHKSNDHNNSNNNKKKDIQKRNSTAEPIIYLFALVFIYLLLKAASDINQHYKTQNKGDKRLRRCSLQSYAQTHKQDRRASKDSPLRRRKHLLDVRSISVDRYKRIIPEQEEEPALLKTEILANLRKYTSLDEQQQQQTRSKASVAIAQHTVTSIKTSNELIKSTDLESPLTPNFNRSRRCSVPVTINYQAVQVATSSVGPNPNRQLQRRISMNSGFGCTDTVAAPSILMDTPLPETKRRVRMINRH